MPFFFRERKVGPPKKEVLCGVTKRTFTLVKILPINKYAGRAFKAIIIIYTGKHKGMPVMPPKPFLLPIHSENEQNKIRVVYNKI